MEIVRFPKMPGTETNDNKLESQTSKWLYTFLYIGVAP